RCPGRFYGPENMVFFLFGKSRRPVLLREGHRQGPWIEKEPPKDPLLPARDPVCGRFRQTNLLCLLWRRFPSFRCGRWPELGFGFLHSLPASFFALQLPAFSR